VNELDDLKSKAKRFLKSAELLLHDGDFDSCASRCYYAMFFLAEAALATKGLRASSHKGVISLFGQHFIKTNVLKEELGRALRRAYDLRQKGDYVTCVSISEDEAKENFENAKTFLEELDKYLISFK
jgi:uncharacterized protein (UPF0332 family)